MKPTYEAEFPIPAAEKTSEQPNTAFDCSYCGQEDCESEHRGDWDPNDDDPASDG